MRGHNPSKRRARFAPWLAGVASVALGVTIPSHAQNAGPAQPGDELVLTEIVVTGSRIRGIAPTGSSVISVGAAQLETTGAVTVQDLVNQIPQNAATGFSEASFSNPFGKQNGTRAGAVNLRGIGPQATLLLLDGHRLVPGATQGAMIDPSALPAKAVQRIEVIADGASAIYGADAVAGVVNIVLRRDLDGVEAEARYGIADGMDQRSFNIAAGKRWETGQFMLAYEHNDRSALAGRDRGWFGSDHRDRGGSDYRLTQCNPANIRIGTTTYPVPAGTVTAASLVPGTANRCELISLIDILPEQKRHNVAATFTQDLADWLRFSAQGFFFHRKFNNQVIAQAATQTQTTITLPSTNPYFIRPAGTTASSILVDYSFAPQFGPRLAYGNERSYQVIGGFDIELPSDWKVNVGGLYGYNEAKLYNSIINQQALAAAVNSTNPATAFNPFAPISREMYDNIYSGIFNPWGENIIKGAELRADGPLFDLPAGPVRAAVGLEYNRLSNNTGTRRGTLAASIFTPVKTARTAKSVYGELHIPVLGDANSNAGRLFLAPALRHDDYSDFGSTTNSKFGLTYEPSDWLELRASYGTSFRAPLLNDTIENNGGALIAGGVRPDPLAGNAQVPVVQIIAGNPNLKPEQATTWSTGFTVKPDTLPGATLTVNYFHIDYSDQIVTAQTDPTILQRRDVYQSVIREFTPALTVAQVLADPEIARLLAQGIATQAIPVQSRYIVDYRPYNLGKTKTDGLDFTLLHQSDLGSGQLTSRIDGTYYFSYKVQQTTTAPMTEELNHYQYPLRFKARGALNWRNDAFGVGAYLNYANAYSNPGSTQHRRIDSYTTIDLHGSLKLPLADTTLALDITNAFNQKPPFVDIDGGYDPGQASAVGRLVALSLRTRF